MNPYAAERMAEQRSADLRAEAARSRAAAAPGRPAGGTGPSVRSLTGWALIQIGLALVTSPARHQHATAISPERP